MRKVADAFNRHCGPVVQGTTTLLNRVAALVPGRQPHHVIKKRMKMLAALPEASAQRSEIGANLSEQVGVRHAALAHRIAQDIDQTAATPDAIEPEAATRAVGKKAS